MMKKVPDTLIHDLVAEHAPASAIVHTPSTLDIPMAAGLPAQIATTRILRKLFTTMQANEAGILSDVDHECLHDFRIAVRRTRCALSQLQEALPTQAVEQFKPEFHWLGEITGPLRDMNVYLLCLDKDMTRLPAGLCQQLSPMHTFLHHKREIELEVLRKHLVSARYHELGDRWKHFLQPGPQTAPDDHGKTILPLANRHIHATFERVLRQGRSINKLSPDDALHELRKSCKKLRYLLEFFARLYGRKQLHKQLKALKKLQDNLGKIQDLAVQSNWLNDIIRSEMDTAGLLGPSTSQGMDYLRMRLRKRQRKARKQFSTCFDKFNSKQRRQELRRMTAPHHAPQSVRASAAANYQ